MTAPRLEIRLDRIGHNARNLVARLAPLGIAVCGVTKATLGAPEVARELLAAGVTSLGESRIECVEHLRAGGVRAPVLLVRSPMPSQVTRVVAGADDSCNSEPGVVELLSDAADRRHRRHGVLLMVELGDLREGLMPDDLHDAVRVVLGLPGVHLRGIGTNLACQSGVIPDAANMAELSALASSVETAFGIELELVSGGNSANLPWALDPGSDTGRVNHLRLGESVLLGLEPVGRTPIDGLHTDAISLVGEVIESKWKHAEPRGTRGQNAFGIVDDRPVAPAWGHRVIVALGRQDVATDGLRAPTGFELLGASSDHLVLACTTDVPAVGSELRFGVDYGALLRAMSSPFVTRRFLGEGSTPAPVGDAAAHAR